jgi:hypothetical protein
MNNYKADLNSLVTVLLFLVLNAASAQDQTKGYFQQEVNYDINVTLNDRTHELSAYESVQYINKSPQSLQFIYFHLWPNAYSNNSTALGRQLFMLKGKQVLFDDPRTAGYIDSLDFRTGNEGISWELMPDMPDICRLNLKEPLEPGDTIIISTPFHVKIPNGNVSRLGHTGWSYQISQWYPKPAVYDMNGWHPMPYLDQGEFFSEFGSFDVSINIPEDYTVGASGDLQTESEISRLDLMASDSSWMFRRPGKGEDSPSGKGMKTLKYHGKQIHDFAWFADRQFHVLKGNVSLPSGKNVTTYSMFTDLEAYLWLNSITYINNAIGKFSGWIGEYPYNTFTAVQSALSAGSGMEYPGLTVIGYAEDPYTLDQVIAHEICHSWFYSYLASDERDYPYMDEGITSAYETRYLDYYYPGIKLWEVYLRNIRMAKFLHLDKLPADRMPEIEWLVQARKNLEQPSTLSAPEYTETNYSNIIYYKTGKAFNMLRNYLGDQLFDSLMHEYYAEWGNRHPYPDDLRKIFENGSGRDLSWFFDDLLGTTKRIDYKVIRLKDDSILVKNKGNMAPPFPVTGSMKDSDVFRKWSEGFTGMKWIRLPDEDYTSVKINKEHTVPEIYYLNNNIRKQGLFRRSDQVSPRLLYSLEDPDQVSVMYTPLLNWNKSDGLMLGLALNNGSLLEKHFEYTLIPFFRFKDAGISGKGKLEYNIFPYNSFIRKTSLSLEGIKFGASEIRNYHAVKAGVDIFFRDRHLVNQVFQRVYGKVIQASDLFMLLQDQSSQGRYFLQTGYTLDRMLPVNTYSFEAGLESGKHYQKAAATLNYRYSYPGRNNGLDVRLFAGAMLNRDRERPYYSLSPSSRTGSELYLFQGEFPDRFARFPHFWSRQMVITEGGLVSPVNDSTGYSRWLLSASFSSSLPGKAGRAPIKPFLNVLYNSRSVNGSPLFYEAGIKAGVWGFFEIHVPLLVSENISTILPTIKERIRFVLSLDTFMRLRLNSNQVN